MRASRLGFLALAIGATSCSKPAIEFVSDGKLSEAEVKSLQALHPELSRWRPHFVASWNRDGIARHVCLLSDGGSIVWPYDVFVFDEAGRIIEANFIDGPSGAWPKSLLSVSPLRVEFTGGGLGDSTVVKELAYRHAEGRQKAVRRAEEKEKLSVAFRAWDRSGRTNSFKEMLDAVTKDTRTDSLK